VIDLADIKFAAERISGHVVRTPVIVNPAFGELLDIELAIKAEHLQRTGSFKVRGVANKLLQLSEKSLRSGVIAGSSGNHGTALAEVASNLGTTAVVIVPADAPQTKQLAIQRRGAKTITFDRFRVERDAFVQEIAAKSNRVIVPSSEDPHIIAGGGTVALELLDQLHSFDALVVPVGGGGLAAGCGTVMAQQNTGIRVYGVEPAGADDTIQSIRAGKRLTIDPPTTLADGLRHRSPGSLTFPIIQDVLHDILVVQDSQIIAAMHLIWTYLGQRAEPSGAAALAGVIAHNRLFRGQRVAVVCTGGNIDPDMWENSMGSLTPR
jgi:threo-3-hydroxy-L-aspartate ammonia-lyase